MEIYRIRNLTRNKDLKPFISSYSGATKVLQATQRRYPKNKYILGILSKNSRYYWKIRAELEVKLKIKKIYSSIVPVKYRIKFNTKPRGAIRSIYFVSDMKTAMKKLRELRRTFLAEVILTKMCHLSSGEYYHIVIAKGGHLSS